MTFWGAIYKLLIGPLELFFEIIFVIANRLIGNYGLSIIVLSLVMNFLVLPLYKRADAIQEKQRETEGKLKKWATHIKKTFKGDERFMMLQTYYRQNNYKPSSILKGSISLLLEIPFFIAAYNFLSNAGVFDGFAFGPFTDMGKPDGLIKIGTLSINLLPILMTAINIVSSAIYTKGLPVSSKVQLYGMAGIFLILLYDSPAALVFYWTLNNLFSLVKNLFYKLKNPKFVFGIIASVAGVCALIFDIVHPFNTLKKNVFVIGLGLLLQLPIIWYFAKKHVKSSKTAELTKCNNVIFYLSVIFLAVLTGILIPSAVINSSPEEFINTVTFANPLSYVISSTLLAIGLFVVWFTIFYRLASDSGKRIMSLAVFTISVFAITNYMFFATNVGTLSSLLVLEHGLDFSKKELLINIVVLMALFIGIYFLWSKKENIAKYICEIAIVCVSGMSVYNCIHANTQVNPTIENLKITDKKNASIPLSKNGKNVMVIMMDRAINSYIPYIFNEKPEVAKQFEGFTYYPNTISYGPSTNFGSPGLYGGYEYIPYESNKRDNVSLKEKQNEALRIMPVLFDENGFETTVFDPTYAGYNWIPDLSIYDDYPDINKYITMGYVGKSIEDMEAKKINALNRNFFVYSLEKICPLALQPTIYNGGNYNKIDSIGQFTHGLYRASGESDVFMNSYAVLNNLSNITKLEDSNKNTFLMMSNDTTHSPCLLQEPEYEPSMNVDNTEYEGSHSDRFTLNGRTMKVENLNQVQHYQINMAALIQLGNYFDYLRENNIYDNTKIIIVADHGRGLNQFDDMKLEGDSNDDVMFYNPLLMVKDFNSKKFVTDNQFMTNADVPTIAFDGLIENPVNPFTGKNINNKYKSYGLQYIIHSFEWHTSINNGNTFLPAPWYTVHDNIFDLNNWEKIEE